MNRSRFRAIALLSALGLVLWAGRQAAAQAARPEGGAAAELTREAVRLHLESRNAEALDRLNSALDIAPDDFDANYLAAIIHRMQGNQGRARHHVLHLAKADRLESIHLLLADWPSLFPDRKDQAERCLALAEIVRRDANPVLAGLVAQHLAAIDRLAGFSRQADARLARLGFIRDWLIIGPFNNERNSGFARTFGPEQELDLSKSYEGRIKPVRWRQAPRLGPSGQLEPAQFLYPAEQELAYAATFVFSPAATDATIRLGAANAVKVWLNDRLILSEETDRTWVDDHFVAPCRLNGGWNKLLVKVCQREKGGFGVAARLTDLAGRPLSGLRFQTSPIPPCTRDAGAAGQPLPAAYAKSSVEQLAERAERNGDDPMAAACLAAELLRCDRANQAIPLLEKLTARQPRCSRFRVLLAYAYMADEKGEKTLEQLQEAVRLEPDYPAALLALGVYHQSTNRLDKAREMFDQAVKLNSGSVAARVERMSFYSSRGWQQEAFDEAERLARQCPDNTEIMSQWISALTGRSYVEQADEATARLRTLSPRSALSWEIGKAKERRDLAAVVAGYRRLLETNQYSISLRMALANEYISHRRFEDARRELEVVLAQNPDLPATHLDLADLHQRTGKDPEALREYAVALELSPQDEHTREYLEFRKPEQLEAFAKYGLSDKQAAEIVAKRPKPEDYPKASAIVLADKGVILVGDDGSSTQLTHRIIQIANENGRDAYGSVRVGGGTPRIQVAVIHKPDGRKVEASKISGGSIHFSGLEVGDVIEYKAIVYAWSGGSWISRHFCETWGFSDANPVLLSELAVLHSPGKPIKWYVNHPESVKYRAEQLGGQAVHVWTGRGFGSLETEPMMPPLRRVLAMVHLSTIPDWQTIAAWEHSMNKDQYESDTLIRAKVAELTAAAKTRQEKIEAIYEFVANKIRYDKSLDSGILGMKPNKAVTVITNQFGDCKDKATLMIVMLRELGVEAYYATILTRERGDIVLEIPSNQCNHAIVYVPDEPGSFQKGRFYDGTAQDYSPNVLPAGDQGRDALIFHNGDYKIVRTPIAPPEQNTLSWEIRAQLQPDGAGQVRFEVDWSGEWAAAMRGAFKEPGRRAQLLESMSNAMTPGARLVGEAKFGDGLADVHKSVNISWQAAAPQLAARGGSQGDKLIVRPVSDMNMTASMAPRLERHYDIFFSRTMKRVFRQRYQLPAGYRVESLPPSGQATTAWTGYSVDYKVQGNELLIERTVTVDKLEAAKSDYPAIRQWCLKVDELERQQVVLAPFPKAVRPGPATAPATTSEEPSATTEADR